jgi:hypothetical protein
VEPNVRDFPFTSSLGRFSTLLGERIETIGMRTAGEPTRIILQARSPDGTDILARRRDAQSTAVRQAPVFPRAWPYSMHQTR